MKCSMLASDSAGNPLGKFAATSSCFAPAETSITEPVIVIGVTVVTPTLGADTVVADGPRPKSSISLLYPSIMFNCPYAMYGKPLTEKPSIAHTSDPSVAFTANVFAPRNVGGLYSCPSSRNILPSATPIPFCSQIGQTP